MNTAFRTVAGIIAGLLVALVLAMAVEMFSAVVHPFPEDFGGTTEEICRHVERYPPWVLAVVIPLWAATAFAAVWTVHKLGHLPAAATLALLLLAALVMNLAMLPYPLWFKLTTPLAVAAAMLLAVQWSRQNLGKDRPDSA